MALFVQVGPGNNVDSGFFNAAFVAAIRFPATNQVVVSLMNPNTTTDVVTITFTTDNDYVTHNVIAQAIVSAAQVQKTGVFRFPETLPGGRTLTMALS